MKPIAGAIIMLASSLCLVAGAIGRIGALERTFSEACILFAGVHFLAGLFVILNGIFTERNK